MGTQRAGERPNLVVVVLDCVRARSFPGTGGAPSGLPTLQLLMKESTIFTQASTVAPWTLPSHASLFTGTYPWEHGVMGEGRLQLSSSTPMGAGMLHRAGYATLALSANGLVGPLLSAPGSFETYRFAESWEKTFRWIAPEKVGVAAARRPRGGATFFTVLRKGMMPSGPAVPPTAFLRTRESTASLEDAVRDARPEEVPLGPRAEALLWAAIDGSNRIARTLRNPETSRPLPVAPWIEPTLGWWLKSQPADRPVHCFVNFLDAHEKYLSDRRLVRGLYSWIRFLRIPQNARRWLSGGWLPTSAELDFLRHLYELTIADMDRRLGSLIDSFKRAGRWENTLLVVTSDHGQAFGEGGELFHERSASEPLLHVPLWVRWPGGRGGGRIRSEHVGIVDILPTLLDAAGIDLPSGLSGVSLQPEPLSVRQSPVLAMADGYPSIENFRDHLDASVLERLRRSYAVGFSGGFKAIVGIRDGTVRVYNVTEDPNEQSNLGSVPGGERAKAETFARSAAEAILRAANGSVDLGVQDRLRSWGYL